MAFPQVDSVGVFNTNGASANVTGQNFQTPALTDVLIDGVSLNPSDWVVQSDTDLLIDPVPIYSVGLHTLRLENADGWWEEPITYSSYPSEFNQVIPNTGDTGDTVDAYFRGFTGTTGVKFDTTDATSFVVIDDERIQAVVPTHAAGTMNVVVEAPGGDVTFINAFTHAGSGGGGGDPHFVGFDGVPFDFQGTESEQAVWYVLYQDPNTTIRASFKRPEDVFMSFVNEIRIHYSHAGMKKEAQVDVDGAAGFLVVDTDPDVVLRGSLPNAIASAWTETVESQLLTLRTDSVAISVSRGLHQDKYKYLNFNLKLLHYHKEATGILGQTLHKDRRPLESFAIGLT